MAFRYICSVLTLITLFTFASCNDDDEAPAVTEVERVTSLLIGSGTIGTTWSIQSVDVDGVDYSDEFTDLTLEFSESGITSTNGREVFGATDSWRFDSDAATSLTTGSQLEIAIAEISENSLILRFTLDESVFGPGRQEAVAGENTFTFNR